MKSLGLPACLLCALLCAILSSTHQPYDDIRRSAAQELQGELSALPVAEGDLIFRRGRSLNSRVVMLADQDSLFSHVGIVIRDSRGPFVVHSVPPDGDSDGGVRVDPIDVFLSDQLAVDWGVFRLIGPARAINGALAAKAAADIANEHSDFDGAFDLTDDRDLYCTELIWKAYKTAGIDLVQGSFDELWLPMIKARKVILPSRLQQSPHLQQVIFSDNRQERS